MLSDKEKEAIEILKSCGWQRIDGAHLEDWDEKPTIRDDDGYEISKIRSTVAIIKV